MAGSLYKDDDDAPITDINVTPFVDVVLVLLVVFMITAKIIVARGVEIPDKPRAATGGEVQSALRVSVMKDGDLYVNGDKFTDDTLAIAKIKDLAAGLEKPKAIITGSRAGAYGNVMRAIDLVQRAGVGIVLENRPLDDK